MLPSESRLVSSIMRRVDWPPDTKSIKIQRREVRPPSYLSLEESTRSDEAIMCSGQASRFNVKRWGIHVRATVQTAKSNIQHLFPDHYNAPKDQGALVHGNPGKIITVAHKTVLETVTNSIFESISSIFFFLIIDDLLVQIR